VAFDLGKPLDEVDWQLLEVLQTEGRITFSELGRRVSMSAPAVAERVRRLEDAGVITGYRAEVDLARLGYQIQALVRISFATGDSRGFEKAILDRPEILECMHVTGEDCFVAKVAATSMSDLEGAIGFLRDFGGTTTSVVLSTPLAWRAVRPAAAHGTESA
jgi:Lrp/AsnC family leucine-responsive transcriptional regulator